MKKIIDVFVLSLLMIEQRLYDITRVKQLHSHFLYENAQNNK